MNEFEETKNHVGTSSFLTGSSTILLTQDKPNVFIAIPKWINSRISLPEPEFPNRYLCTDGEDIEIMTYHGTDRHGEQGEWSSSSCNTIDVKWWMSLPELPQ